MTNLTPHSIRVLSSPEGALLAEVPPSGKTARVAVKTVQTGTVEIAGAQVPVYSTEFGSVEGLPADGGPYIVSLAVRQAVPSRTDIFSTGELKRGPDGQPVGCVGLVGNGVAL